MAKIHNNLGNLYNETKKYKKAEEEFKNSLSIKRGLSKIDPNIYLPEVAITLNNLGALYNDIKRYNDSKNVYLESLKIRQKLSDKNPNVYLPFLANTLSQQFFFFYSF